MSANGVFAKRFLDTKSLYLYTFNKLPSVRFMGWINGEKAYKAFKEKFSAFIVSEHEYRFYDKKRKNCQFDETVLVLNNNCLIEFDEGYCRMLHDNSCPAFINECVELMRRFKERQRRQPLEINLIIENSYGLDLKAMEIKKTKLDLSLYYEDDFKEVDEVIRQRLNKKGDKGIILLHGLPGTGKTTYLRYLIGKIKKRVLFLSPNIARNLMNPDFIDLLIDNPNTVVVIEDAEQIIMDRKTNEGSAVSNLLNISDGLLADFLNVQLICTFNSSLTMVDSALLRKGRLIAKYEFGRLSIKKAQQLSNHLGYDQIIDRPMTLAEIAGQNEKEFNTKQVGVIGFRRSVLQN